jgi:protein gp37
MSDLFGIGIPEGWQRKVFSSIKTNPRDRFYLLTKQPQNLAKWSPFPDNCWVGVTATDFKMFGEALYYLGQIEASIKYISLEPFLSRILADRGSGGYDVRMLSLDLGNWLDWVIIGAQTKPTVMPKIEWVQEIETTARKAGIPVFLKDNLKPLFEPLMRVPNMAWWGNVFGLRQEMPHY